MPVAAPASTLPVTAPGQGRRAAQRDHRRMMKYAVLAGSLLLAPLSNAQTTAGWPVKPLNCASASGGTLQHIAPQLVAREAKIDVVHVAYEGSQQALADSLNFQVGSTFDLGAAIDQIRADKVRLLAVPNSARSSLFPNTPTMIEAGTSASSPPTPRHAAYRFCAGPHGTTQAAGLHVAKGIEQWLQANGTKPDYRRRTQNQSAVRFSVLIILRFCSSDRLTSDRNSSGVDNWISVA